MAAPQAATQSQIIVVASQEHADGLRDASRAMDGRTLDLPPTSFFVIDSIEAERAYTAMLFEQVLGNAGTAIVDLRSSGQDKCRLEEKAMRQLN